MQKTSNSRGIRAVIICIVIISLFVAASTTYAAPYTFSEGEVVSASKMNANFSALESAINSSSNISRRVVIESAVKGISYSWYFSEMITASCGANEILSGGSCSCAHNDWNSSTTNTGAVSFCDFFGNTVLGSCESDGYFGDSNKYGPPITVYAVCLSTGSSLNLMDTSTPIPILLEEEAKLEKEVKRRKMIVEKIVQERLSTQE